MAAAAASIPLDIDFNNRLSALLAVSTAVNTNLAYWNKTALRGVVPDPSGANSKRRYVSELNSMIAAIAATMTGFAMSSPPAQYASIDYHDFQSVLSGIIAQNNAIVTAHP